MDISTIKSPVDLGSPSNPLQKERLTQPVANIITEKLSDVGEKSITASAEDKAKNRKIELKEVTQMTEAMNKFVQAMNANIRFTVHEKSNQLMVQVVDQANDIVLKEFPSGEFLDTMAAIRDYVGILLDKKI